MIPLFKPFVSDAVDEPLLQTLHSGYIGQGQKVEEFEKCFSEYIGSPYCVSVNSCTAALTLALRLSDVAWGSACISTAQTCTVTNQTIMAVGGTPIFSDIYPETGLINPWDIEARITSHTKAIMAVDWGGYPVDVENLMYIANKHGLKLIIDAAHSLGSEYTDGSKVGSAGDFVCFSLQAIKTITSVDGGVLVCRDYDDYKRAKLLRWFGIDREQNNAQSNIDVDIHEWGYKFHMNDVTATIAQIQMDHLDGVLAKYRTNALYYDLHLSEEFITPYSSTGAYSSYWLYTILLPEAGQQANFKKWMADEGIMVDQVHRRNDSYTLFAPYRNNALHGLSSFSDRMMCIPVHWSLSETDREHIVKTANRFVEGK